MVEERKLEFDASKHGIDCPKVPHFGEGYLHAKDDDSPYSVDGVIYCGRCHGWMGILGFSVRFNKNEELVITELDKE